MANENIKALIEAVFFISDSVVTPEQLKKVLDGYNTNEICGFINEMAKQMEEENRGLRIIEVAGGYRMVTSPHLSPFLKKLYKERRVEKLSKPALETLAIIAYKQPVTRLEIESLRNVNVDGVINSLMDKGLIRITGVKKAPGRPKVYGTTKQFLEYFGLKSLEDLPKIEDFSQLASERQAQMEKEIENGDTKAKATD